MDVNETFTLGDGNKVETMTIFFKFVIRMVVEPIQSNLTNNILRILTKTDKSIM